MIICNHTLCKKNAKGVPITKVPFNHFREINMKFRNSVFPTCLMCNMTEAQTQLLAMFPTSSPTKKNINHTAAWSAAHFAGSPPIILLEAPEGQFKSSSPPKKLDAGWPESEEEQVGNVKLEEEVTRRSKDW